MATHATNIAAPRGFLGHVVAGFERVFSTLVKIGEAQPRYRKLQHYAAMSDEELAALGLKRDEIVQHVYRDVFYA